MSRRRTRIEDHEYEYAARMAEFGWWEQVTEEDLFERMGRRGMDEFHGHVRRENRLSYLTFGILQDICWLPGCVAQIVIRYLDEPVAIATGIMWYGSRAQYEELEDILSRINPTQSKGSISGSRKRPCL